MPSFLREHNTINNTAANRWLALNELFSPYQYLALNLRDKLIKSTKQECSFYNSKETKMTLGFIGKLEFKFRCRSGCFCSPPSYWEPPCGLVCNVSRSLILILLHVQPSVAQLKANEKRDLAAGTEWDNSSQKHEQVWQKLRSKNTSHLVTRLADHGANV